MRRFISSLKRHMQGCTLPDFPIRGSEESVNLHQAAKKTALHPCRGTSNHCELLLNTLSLHRASQKAAYDMVMTWSMDDHQNLRSQVPSKGLHTPFQGGTLQDVAKKVRHHFRNILLMMLRASQRCCSNALPGADNLLLLDRSHG